MTARMLVVVLALAGCRREPVHTYPPDVVENFLRSCGRRASEGVCRCALTEMERRYTAEEFRAFEVRAAKGEIAKELVDAAAACR